MFTGCATGDCPDYRWCFAGPAPSTTGLTDLAVTAAAAAAASKSRSSVVTPHATALASAHLRISLSDFAPVAAAGSNGSSNGGAYIGAFSAAVAAAFERETAKGGKKGRSAAAAAAAAGGAGGLEALAPHVCSLALLPPGALEHVPSAVQHLMVEGSAVYDMYASCSGGWRARAACVQRRKGWGPQGVKVSPARVGVVVTTSTTIRGPLDLPCVNAHCRSFVAVNNGAYWHAYDCPAVHAGSWPRGDYLQHCHCCCS